MEQLASSAEDVISIGVFHLVIGLIQLLVVSHFVMLILINPDVFVKAEAAQKRDNETNNQRYPLHINIKFLLFILEECLLFAQLPFVISFHYFLTLDSASV